LAPLRLAQTFATKTWKPGSSGKNGIGSLGFGSFGSSHPVSFINIALTLQRMEEPNRTNGLALFERLIELDAYSAREALMDIDRRPGAALSSLPRRRRGRHKRAK